MLCQKAYISKIVPIGKEMKKMISDKKYLDSVLNKGAEAAEEDARKNLIQKKYYRI